MIDDFPLGPSETSRTDNNNEPRSLWAGDFFVFLIFELFPTVFQVNSYYFPYLGTRYDYETDPELVFRARPTHRVFESFGSEFKEEYRQFGADISPVTFDITIGPSGFREDSTSPHPEIIVLGDSFIQIAENSSDSFSMRLQAVSGVGTLNRGLAWYGPFQYLETLRRVAVSPEMKVALFCFFEGNDLSDIREYLKWKSGGAYYDHYLLHPDTTIFRRFSFFLDDLVLLRSRLPVKFPFEFYGKQLMEIDLNGKRMETRFAGLPDNRKPKEILASVDGVALGKILSQFKRLALKENIYPVLVFIPTGAHVYAPLATDNSGADWKKMSARVLPNLDNVEAAVQTLARERDLAFIDLLPLFQEKARKGELLYYPFDSHWNSMGREAAAETIAKRLREMGKLTFGK